MASCHHMNIFSCLSLGVLKLRVLDENLNAIGYLGGVPGNTGNGLGK